MSAETHTVADDQVRSAFKRWQNLEEEKARVADDLKELFAEQKALGHDTKAMRAAFRLKVKLDEADPAEAEHEALVDTYLAALEAPRASRAYAREKIEQFDATPRLIKQVVDGMQTEAGRAALLTAVDIMIEREDAEEAEPEAAAEVAGNDLREPVAAERGQIIREGDAPRETDRLGGDASRRDTDQPETADELQHPVSLLIGDPEPALGAANPPSGDDGMVRGARTEADAVTAGETAPHSDQPLKGGDEDPRVVGVPTSNTGEGTALSALPAKPKFVLRPHCLNPGPACGGHGSNHCTSCKKAMAEKSEVAA